MLEDSVIVDPEDVETGGGILDSVTVVAVEIGGGTVYDPEEVESVTGGGMLDDSVRVVSDELEEVNTGGGTDWVALVKDDPEVDPGVFVVVTVPVVTVVIVVIDSEVVEELPMLEVLPPVLVGGPYVVELPEEPVLELLGAVEVLLSVEELPVDPVEAPDEVDDVPDCVVPGVVPDEGTELDPMVTLLVSLETGSVIVEVKVDVVPGWLGVLALDSLLEVV
ncbi:hypothetical protein SLS62_005879 [Diatrype stigma]|uniref:Uncharacterized protein n=1 Tax=Diatrype stigma TaxID=117547 RepID=A0AAN9YSD3_9PEZI